jgi:hypothetical protein
MPVLHGAARPVLVMLPIKIALSNAERFYVESDEQRDHFAAAFLLQGF